MPDLFPSLPLVLSPLPSTSFFLLPSSCYFCFLIFCFFSCADMSDAGERQQCGDANVVHFANSITAAIKAIDPEAMVTVGMFTFNVRLSSSSPPPLPPLSLLLYHLFIFVFFFSVSYIYKQAVGKTGPQGFLPIPGPKDDPRFPASPASLSIWSTLVSPLPPPLFSPLLSFPLPLLIQLISSCFSLLVLFRYPHLSLCAELQHRN